jgi:uncharacterized protein (TIGR03435 family)
MRIAFALSLAVTTVVVSAQAPAFEVVSIKEAPPPGAGPFRFGLGPQPGGRWEALNATVVNMLRDAWPDFRFDTQIVGGPDWLRSRRFDVNATGKGDVPRDQMRLMVRQMLAARFGLKARVEPRGIDVYALVVARSDGRLGPNMKVSTLDCEALAAARKRGDLPTPAFPGPPAPGQPLPRVECGFMSQVLASGAQRMMISGQPLSSVVSSLQAGAGRPVLDRTGLTGKYDIDIEFARTTGPRSADTLDPNAPPSVFTAVQEQLGLKLEPRKEAMDVLVIEYVHLPTAD